MAPEIRAEKDDRPGDVARVCNATKWNRSSDAVAATVGKRTLAHFRVDPARRDAVDGDAALRELDAQGFHVGDHRALRRGIVGVKCLTALAGGTRHEDDSAAVVHESRRGARREE